MEPVTGTTAAAGTAGLLSLLILAFGPAGADVAIVTLSALAGSIVSLTATKRDGFWQSIGFIAVGIIVSLVLSWALSSAVTAWIPSLAGPYTTSIIAFCIGFASDKIPSIMDVVVKRFTNKIKDSK